MKSKALKSLAMIVALIATNAVADESFVITELYSGVSGADGTQDWIEVTNVGTMTGDTSTLLFDDSTPVVANSGVLTSFMLAPGQSAVFLLDSDPVDDVNFTSAIEEFEAIWGVSGNIGLTNGGGNLGQSSDAANIGFDDGMGNFSIIDSLIYGSDLGGEFFTAEDPTGLGIPSGSVIGVNGAFESNAFDNGGPVTLAGSPLTAVPEPTAAIALSLCSLSLIRRRR